MQKDEAILFNRIIMMALYVLLAVFAAIGLYFKWQNTFWKRRKIRGPTPQPIFGNLYDYFRMKRHFGHIYHDIYKSFSNAAYVGIYKFSTPSILIRDISLVKSILVENFNSFKDNDFNIDTKLDPLMSKNPTFSPQWKQTRNQITPMFTSAKMKQVFPLVADICRKFAEYIKSSPDRTEFEARSLSSKVTIESIAACAFGLEAEAFTNDQSAFIKNSRKVFDPSTAQTIRTLFAVFLPVMNNILRIPFLPKDVDIWLRAIIRDVVDRRDSGIEKRSDFLQMILELRNKSSTIIFDEDLIVGHALSFLLDGFETSSITMTYCLYHLATNKSIQQNVQIEIDRILAENDGQLTEQGVRSMDYLERTLYETLRMNCQDFMMARLCTKEFKLPPQCAEDEDGLTIPVGMPVMIPVYSIHKDPNYYPNPDIFDPNRFTDENIRERPKCTFLAFGDGPRMCPGIKFGMMQTKAIMATILSQYNVELSERTKEPLSVSTKSLMLYCEDGIWIRFKKRLV